MLTLKKKLVLTWFSPWFTCAIQRFFSSSWLRYLKNTLGKNQGRGFLVSWRATLKTLRARTSKHQPDSWSPSTLPSLYLGFKVVFTETAYSRVKLKDKINIPTLCVSDSDAPPFLENYCKCIQVQTLFFFLLPSDHLMIITFFLNWNNIGVMWYCDQNKQINEMKCFLWKKWHRCQHICLNIQCISNVDSCHKDSSTTWMLPKGQ